MLISRQMLIKTKKKKKILKQMHSKTKKMLVTKTKWRYTKTRMQKKTKKLKIAIQTPILKQKLGLVIKSRRLMKQETKVYRGLHYLSLFLTSQKLL